jgi:peptide/nickel transport system substrate-binding protein
MKDAKKNFTGLTRRDFLYFAGAGMSGIALGGIPELGHGQEKEEKKPKYGGRVRFGNAWGSSGLDVHKNQDFSDYLHYCLMYGGLADVGALPQVEMYPMLAKSWEISNDGREYIFSLREGIKFHHGKEMDSGDVKYSFDRVLNPATRSPRAFAFRWVDSVNVIDKYHIKFRLKEPFAPFITTLTPYNCAIIPAGVEPTATKPAPGTGPFIFKSFQPNETFEVTRFNQYWEVDEKTGDRLPYVDAVYMKKITDPFVRWTALRAGDLDITYGPPENVVAEAILQKPVPGIYVDYDCPGNSGWVWFNMSKPPFNNKKVRQAVAYALDKKSIIKAVFWGLGETVNNQPFLNRSRFYIPVKEREVDLAKAKQLLAEAGYPNGFKTKFLQFSFNYDVRGAEAAIGELKKIGIEATMEVLDRVPFYVKMRKGEYEISFTGVDERFDWDDAFYMFLHSSEIDKNNWSRYNNQRMDTLLEKGRTTWKFEERKPIYKEVIETVMEDVPVLFLYKTVVGYALQSQLKGFRKGFGLRPAWHGGGTKYWWLDK